MSVPSSRLESRFFVVGGTLAKDAPCYVVREADDALYRSLMSGELCYVLTSRQMGKSSLMVRTASRLRESSVRTAVLDLTSLGRSLTEEQWYEGLLQKMGRQLRLETELEAFWLDHPQASAFQRWMGAVSDVVLRGESRPVVVFIDEIDFVLSLPFSTDAFFAGIRALHNRRTEEPDLLRLTFCLLGVASPTDLVRDTRTTPFNVGRRVEIHDFTAAEASPLSEGLRDGAFGSAALSRVFYWTGGHPYLTQRLCQAVSEDVRVKDVRGVDRKCEELFFTRSAQQQDSNLLFVRDRLLRSDVDVGALLGLYEKVRRSRPVEDDEASPLAGVLKLSGVTRSEKGRLRVRNRIYARVFNRRWVRENLPGAELRRQRAAYRKGLFRAAAVAAVVVTTVAALAGMALHQRNLAWEQERLNAKLLYAAHLSVAQRHLESSQRTRAEDLLKAHIPGEGEEDLRGFEWYYLWRLCCRDPASLRHGANVLSVAFSPDGSTIASAGEDGTIRLWDPRTRKLRATLRGHTGYVTSTPFMPDGKSLLSGSLDGTLKLWDVSRHSVLRTITTHAVSSLSLSSDGKTLATGGTDRIVVVRDATTLEEITKIRTRIGILGVAVSPDGRYLAVAGNTGRLDVWDVASGRVWKSFGDDSAGGWTLSVRFALDGRTLAATSSIRTARVWDLRTGTELLTIERPAQVRAAAFSRDGKRLAIALAARDASVQVFDVRTALPIATFSGHFDNVNALDFSPDGRTLASGSADRTVRLWDLGTAESVAAESVAAPEDVFRVSDRTIPRSAFSIGQYVALSRVGPRATLWDAQDGSELLSLSGHKSAISAISISTDGAVVLTGSFDHTAKIWDRATRRELVEFALHEGAVNSGSISPNGKLAATGSRDGTVRVWEVETGRQVHVFRSAPNFPYSEAFSPDGTILAVGEDDRVRLWDLATGRERVSIVSAGSIFRHLAFSPDGKHLAATGARSIVLLWDVAANRQLAQMRTDSSAWSSAFSPDGRTLATGTETSIKLWQVATGEEILTLKGHSDYVDGVYFTPDGSGLISVGWDGHVKRWRAARKQEVTAQLDEEKP